MWHNTDASPRLVTTFPARCWFRPLRPPHSRPAVCLSSSSFSYISNMLDVQQNRTLKEYLGTFKCVRLLPWCTGWKVQLWLGGWYKMEPWRLFRYHKKENLVLQCSPWPEVTYVNNSPSPGFNNTHNSFPVAEGYDFFTLPPMSPGTVELHLIKKKKKR